MAANSVRGGVIELDASDEEWEDCEDWQWKAMKNVRWSFRQQVRPYLERMHASEVTDANPNAASRPAAGAWPSPTAHGPRQSRRRGAGGRVVQPLCRKFAYISTVKKSRTGTIVSGVVEFGSTGVGDQTHTRRPRATGKGKGKG